MQSLAAFVRLKRSRPPSVLLEELLPAISGIELPEQPRAVRAEFPLGGWASRPVILR